METEVCGIQEAEQLKVRREAIWSTNQEVRVATYAAMAETRAGVPSNVRERAFCVDLWYTVMRGQDWDRRKLDQQTASSSHTERASLS